MAYEITQNMRMITIVIAIVAMILLGWILYPTIMGPSNEGMENVNGEANGETDDEQTMTPEEATKEEKPDNMEENGPVFDAATGTIMDGPGYERSEIEGTPAVPSTSVPSNYYFLDDGSGGEQSIQHNLCSKSCCSAQWPTPFKLKYDPYVCQNKDKFIPSNIFCSNTFQDSGCLCLSKQQARFLYNRGGNGRELF